MCQAVCPVYNQTFQESDVARGKISILQGIISNVINSPESTFERLQKCLLCGSCSINCPNNINTVELFIKAKYLLAEFASIHPVSRKILKQFFSHPPIFNLFFEVASKFQHLFLKSNLPYLKNRHLPNIKSNPFYKILPSIELKKFPNNPRVVFFVGCIINFLFPEIALSTIKALNHHKINIYIPPNQLCCGIPALSIGDRKSFLISMKHNLKLLNPESFDFLVTSCATCTFTIKKLWPVISSSESENIKQHINRIANKTIDINQFLSSNCNLEYPSDLKTNLSLPVTYHDPCHLKKSLGVFKQPREILKFATNNHYVEMSNPDSCCGLGGSFGILHNNLSKDIGNTKVSNITKSNCSSVATSCPACIIQLKDALKRNNINIPVFHTIEVYSNSI